MDRSFEIKGDVYMIPDTTIHARLWSGGQDLNLRQSGVCTLGRLNVVYLM